MNVEKNFSNRVTGYRIIDGRQSWSIEPLCRMEDHSTSKTGSHGTCWTGIWRNGVFDYQHYHSGAREVLGVGRCSATLLIGGPTGQAFAVSTGDCLILPAGTGHPKLVSSLDFQVVGAYPPGQHADIQTAAPTPAMQETIMSVPLPEKDPLFGSTGGLLEAWR